MFLFEGTFHLMQLQTEPWKERRESSPRLLEVGPKGAFLSPSDATNENKRDNMTTQNAFA